VQFETLYFRIVIDLGKFVTCNLPFCRKENESFCHALSWEAKIEGNIISLQRLFNKKEKGIDK
jgi:hypothetical protein